MSKKTFKAKGIVIKCDTKKDVVKVSIGRASVDMKVIDFWGIAFSMVNSEMKDQLLPVRKEEMMKFKRVHKIQLEKDMKAGEVITVACTIDVPLTIAEGKKNIIGGELSTPIKIDDVVKGGV